MAINPDFRDLLSEFSGRDVRFLVVGGYAVNFHGVHRLTKDLDLWVDPEASNARRAWEALAAFGAPIKDVQPEDFSDPGTILQVGVAPNRIDVITTVVGVDFPDAWRRRVASSYGGVPVHYIGLDDLLRNKRAVGRVRDRRDVSRFERRAKRSKKP